MIQLYLSFQLSCKTIMRPFQKDQQLDFLFCTFSNLLAREWGPTTLSKGGCKLFTKNLPNSNKPRGILKLQTSSLNQWAVLKLSHSLFFNHRDLFIQYWALLLMKKLSFVWITQTAPEKNRLDRFKITFLIRHYNDIVLYMVPPVKIGVRAAPQGV